MSYGYAYPQYAPQYPAAQAYPARRSAPPSVHTVAILQYLGGLLQIAAAAALALAPADVLAGQTIVFDAGARVPLTYVVAGVVALFGLITIALGRKAQRGRQWARVLLVILSLLAIAGTGLSFAQTGAASVATGLIVPVLYLLLLNTRAARSWFRYRTW